MLPGRPERGLTEINREAASEAKICTMLPTIERNVPGIVAEGLSRRFGERLAVDAVSFEVARGEVFGFLGPNGAGKSTTVRMLTGFIPPSEGRARIAGFDVVTHSTAARRHIGVVPEEANVYADLTVRQNVMFMAELHGVSKPRRLQRAGELLECFDLAARAAQKGRELSKGLRQRLMLCMALVSDPDVLFLDEPTSGLDVASTRLIHDTVAELNRDRGMTVFLTTHNMQEADQMCHRVAIIDCGVLAAIDTPQALRSRVESRRSVEVRFEKLDMAPEELFGAEKAEEIASLPDGFRAFGARPGAMAQAIASNAAARGLAIQSIRTLEPTLEEVFVTITSGKR